MKFQSIGDLCSEMGTNLELKKEFKKLRDFVQAALEKAGSLHARVTWKDCEDEPGQTRLIFNDERLTQLEHPEDQAMEYKDYFQSMETQLATEKDTTSSR